MTLHQACGWQCLASAPAAVAPSRLPDAVLAGCSARFRQAQPQPGWCNLPPTWPFAMEKSVPLGRRAGRQGAALPSGRGAGSFSQSRHAPRSSHGVGVEDGLAVASAGGAGLGVALGQAGQGGDVAHGAGCQVGPGGIASQGDLAAGGYLVQLALGGPGDGPAHRRLDWDEAGVEGFGAGGDEVRHGGRFLWVDWLVGRSVPDGLLLDPRLSGLPGVVLWRAVPGRGGVGLVVSSRPRDGGVGRDMEVTSSVVATCQVPRQPGVTCCSTGAWPADEHALAVGRLRWRA